MASVMKWGGAAAGTALVFLCLAAPAVQAQNPYFQVRPGLTPQQYNNMALYGRAVQQQYLNNAAFGYASGWGMNPYAGYAAPPAGSASMYTSPYGGAASMTSSPYEGSVYGPYGPGSYYNPYQPYNIDPYGGYMRGGADVIAAQGRFLVNIQQANLIREQVRAERMANRRRAFEEYLYERERTPTLEQERERRLIAERDRARSDPPVTEIWSGKALNDVMGELRALRAKGLLVASRAPNIPLDEDLLKHINVTGKDGGNIGLLKNEGRLTWPVALGGDDLKAERERLAEMAQDAIGQAKFKNTVDAGTLKQMQNDLERMHKQLSRNVGDLPTAQYIEARRFLNNFDDAVRVLGTANSGNYVTRKWSAKGKNIVEVVDGLMGAGLQFAPAVAGDEAAYVSLHRALAAYATAMQSQVATEPQK